MFRHDSEGMTAETRGNIIRSCLRGGERGERAEERGREGRKLRKGRNERR